MTQQTPEKTPTTPQPQPRGVAQANTKLKNRMILMGLLFVFIFPFALALYLYQNPGSRLLSPGQHGQLIVPPQPISQLTQQTQPQRAWKILLMTTEPCEQRCHDLLNAIHRLARSTGKEERRLQRWLISPNRVDWFDGDARFDVFQANQYQIAKYATELPTQSGGVEVTDLSLAIYLVDPNDFILMVYPQDTDFKMLRKDLMRLLKASRVG